MTAQQRLLISCVGVAAGMGAVVSSIVADKVGLHHNLLFELPVDLAFTAAISIPCYFVFRLRRRQ